MSAWSEPFFEYNRQAEGLHCAQNWPQVPALAQDMQQKLRSKASYAANQALQKGLIAMFERVTVRSAATTVAFRLRLTCHKRR